MFKPSRKKNEPGKWATRLLVFFLITSIAFALDARPASAHAFLLRTEPSDGSALASAPKQMRLWFSEPIEIDLTAIALQDGKNKTWQLKPYADPNDPSIVIVDLPELPPGAYRVTWRTVSDEDFHIVSGGVVFGIQQAVNREATAQTQNAAPLSELTFHWIHLLSFAGLIGALINILFLFPSIKIKTKDEQSLILLSTLQGKTISLALWCGVIALIAGLFTLWEKSVTTLDSIQNWKQITSIVYIQRELMSELCLIAIILTIFYWIKGKENTGRIGNIFLFSLVSLWIVFQSLNSHALAFNDFSAARVLAYAFHLLGAGLWIGGQIALIFFIAPRLRSRSENYVLAREIYARFGAMAASGVAILIVTGLYNGGQQVASLDALLLTDYGKALTLKSALVILSGLIGLSHASHFHPKVAAVIDKFVPPQAARIIFGKADPTSTLRLELMGGVAIFLLAAFMSSTQPARGPEFEAPVQSPAASSQPVSSSNMADDLLVNFSIKPNQPGQNFISVGVFNTRRPVPGVIDEVIVKLIPPDAQNEIQIDLSAAQSDGKGNYQVLTDAINISGDWTVSVAVHRAGLQDAVLDLPWKVAPPAPTIVRRPTVISSRPLAPLLTLASLLLSIVFSAAWLVVTLNPNLFRPPDRKMTSTSQETNL